LEEKRALLLSAVDPDMPVPDADAVLLQKAEAALHREDAVRAGEYLAAAEDHSTPRWRYLRGEVCFAMGEYREAAAHLLRVEEAYPDAVIPKLERCFSELEDYKMAYHYACKQKN
jgi:lipopolysaccharide biosynthesis regulator YciM